MSLWDFSPAEMQQVYFYGSILKSAQSHGLKLPFFFFDYNNKDFAAGSLISICAKQAQREIQMLFRVLKELKEQFHQPRL